jgi:hypothetical protein
MATSDILGLFMSPEQYQAQQMVQQQTGDEQRAINFANLDPRGQANYGTFLGAQQLGRGIGGLLGVQDPQLQRIRQRQEIMQSINPADMASLEQGILRASQTNDPELALTLANYRRDAASNIALAKQRETEKVPQDILIAAKIRDLTEARLKLPENERGPIDAQIKRLEKLGRPGAENKVEQLRDLLDEREEAVAQFGVDSNAVKSIDRMINVVAPLKGGAGGDGDGEDGDGKGKGKYKEIAISRERAKLTATLRSLDSQNMAGSPEYLEAQDQLNFLNQAVVTKPSDVEFKLAQARPLIAQRNDLLAQGFAPDSREIRDIDDELAILGAKRGDGKGEKGDKTFESVVKSEVVGTLTEQLETLKAEGREDTPEYRRKVAELKSLQGDKGDKEVRELVLTDAVVGLRKRIRDAKDPNAPEIVEAKDRLAVLEQQLKTANPDLKIVGEVRSGPDKGKPVYVDAVKDQQFVFSKNAQGEQVRKLVSDVDVDRMTSKITASASSNSQQTQENEFSKGLGRLQAKRYDDASSLRDNSITALNSLDALVKLDNRGLISGAFATDRVGLTNFLDSLGFTSQKDKEKLASSENYQKVAGDVVLAALGGKLGAGFSNEDRKFINGLIPQLETSAAARKQLLDYLTRKNKEIVEETTRLMDFAETKRTLNGYVPRIKLPSSSPSALSNMTKDELEAAIAKKRKEGK